MVSRRMSDKAWRMEARAPTIFMPPPSLSNAALQRTRLPMPEESMVGTFERSRMIWVQPEATALVQRARKSSRFGPCDNRPSTLIKAVMPSFRNSTAIRETLVQVLASWQPRQGYNRNARVVMADSLYLSLWFPSFDAEE